MKVPVLVGVSAVLAGLFSLFAAANSRGAPGDLYISDVAGKQILKFSPDGSRSVFASGIDAVGQMAFDRTGNLFVTESSQPGRILKFTPDGTESTFASGISLPGWPAFDGNGNLFVRESFGDIGNILKFTPSGTQSTFASGGYFSGLTFDSVGNLFAATSGPTALNGGIVYYDPDGTAHSFSDSFAGPGLAIAAEGDIFSTSGDSIFELPRTPSPPVTVFATGFDGPLDLAFDGAGNLFVSETGSGSILKFSPDGTRSTFATGFAGLAYLAFEPITEKLRNLSARGLVGTGEGALIGGFIVGGSALSNNGVVVRAIGPSLSQAGVTNPLADPTLELHNASGAIVASNDDWQDDQEAEIDATGLAPTEPNESAIYATLPAGSYTAVVRGAGETTGVALVEVYSIGQ